MLYRGVSIDRSVDELRTSLMLPNFELMHEKEESEKPSKAARDFVSCNQFNQETFMAELKNVSVKFQEKRIEELRSNFGHKITCFEAARFSPKVQVIQRKDGKLLAKSDPRKIGKPSGR